MSGKISDPAAAVIHMWGSNSFYALVSPNYRNKIYEYLLTSVPFHSTIIVTGVRSHKKRLRPLRAKPFK
jgi:hypothetical protein